MLDSFHKLLSCRTNSHIITVIKWICSDVSAVTRSVLTGWSRQVNAIHRCIGSVQCWPISILLGLQPSSPQGGGSSTCIPDCIFSCFQDYCGRGIYLKITVSWKQVSRVSMALPVYRLKKQARWFQWCWEALSVSGGSRALGWGATLNFILSSGDVSVIEDNCASVPMLLLQDCIIYMLQPLDLSFFLLMLLH